MADPKYRVPDYVTGEYVQGRAIEYAAAVLAVAIGEKGERAMGRLEAARTAINQPPYKFNTATYVVGALAEQFDPGVPEEPA